MLPQSGSSGFATLRLPERSPVTSLLRRIGLAVAIVIAVALLLWFTRDGLRDNAHPDRPLQFVDVFYFTVITLATVGYGDIAPVSAEARLLNALLLTPIRIFLWIIFLGTAYELVLQRYRERAYMSQMRERLRGHSIICGFGVKGRAIVSELLAHGHALEDIIIIEPNEVAAQEAAAQGLVALRGDASSEAVLRSAAVEKAGHVLVAPHRDDECVLICLTVRTLAPGVRLVAAAREEENVKLLYRAGADVVVSPSVSGGRLMGAAVRQQAVTRFLQDLLTFGQGMDTAEWVVRPDEEGLLVRDIKELQDKLVLGVARGDEHCSFHLLGSYRLKPGDVVVYLTSSSDCTKTQTK